MQFPMIFIVTVIFLSTVDSSKILFISPNLSNSMVIYTGRIADVLSKAGHNVTFFIPQITPAQINGTNLAKVVRMTDLGTDFLEHMQEHAGDIFNPHPTIFSRRSEFTVLRKICEKILMRKNELNWLKNERFDLAIVSNLDFCDIGLVKLLEIPMHIWTTTGPIHDITAWTIGIPPETSYAPTMWDNFMGPIMTVRERLTNFVRIYTDRLLVVEHNYRMTQLFRKYVHPDFPEMTKLASDSALLFVNGNEFLDPVRPLPSKVIQIGGVGLSKPPALSDQWIEMAHKGKKGFILFSLGTAAPTIVISEQNKRQIVQAFTQFPDYQFIVKADREDEIFRNLSLQTSNVDVVSWLPQTGLLSHPNAKLFITHGGYNSILESSLSGVPMLVMPLFFDQHHNAKTAEYRGIARALKPNELNANVLRREINILLNDPSYKINAKRISKLSKMKPNQPDETLLNWVNFALANGPLPELRPELLNLSFISYNNIDLLGIGVAILFIIFQLIRLIVSFNVMNRIRVIQKTKSC